MFKERIKLKEKIRNNKVPYLPQAVPSLVPQQKKEKKKGTISASIKQRALCFLALQNEGLNSLLSL